MTVIAVAALVGCGGEPLGPSGDAFAWRLPARFPAPLVPDSNPMSNAKVDLGRHLFYDRRMSITQEFSCASCHQQSRAFTDGLPVAVGATGQPHPRNSMTLANVAYPSSLNWANPLTRNHEQQALIPMFGDNPVELGLSGEEEALLARFRADRTYQQLFPAAFPGAGDPFSIDAIAKALATFQRTIISGDAPYDRYLAGNRGAISESAVRGESLFFSERLECHHCHSSFNLSGSVQYVGKEFRDQEFFNNGLYNIGGTGAYPDNNRGIFTFTLKPEDMGRFKAPTLRNIAVTAPYMHDGSIATLDEVIDHYAAGGRTSSRGRLPATAARVRSRADFVLGLHTDARRTRGYPRLPAEPDGRGVPERSAILESLARRRARRPLTMVLISQCRTSPSATFPIFASVDTSLHPRRSTA